jgi:catechol 2,3-dioxygenase-like lactoylglutathione lyase family enzyme
MGAAANPMAKLQVTDLEIYVKDLKATRAFYTRKIGLKVRSSMPKWGYLALGATKGGQDAALTPWQPLPQWGQEMYESRLKMIGGVTGIGFLTNDLKGTVADLKKKGVKTAIEREDGTFGRFTDPDGNVLFIAQPEKPKVRRKGLSALSFVTVVSRDAKQSGEFFKKALGMKAHRVPGEEGFTDYRFSPKGTSIMPFTPTKEMYENPSDFDSDMAHIGEETGIGFSTDSIYKLQEQLLAKGVRFKQKAEAQDWGGISARFFDPDDNVYSLVEYKG